MHDLGLNSFHHKLLTSERNVIVNPILHQDTIPQITNEIYNIDSVASFQRRFNVFLNLALRPPPLKKVFKKLFLKIFFLFCQMFFDNLVFLIYFQITMYSNIILTGVNRKRLPCS